MKDEKSRFKGHLFFTEKMNLPECQAISKNTGRRCINAGTIPLDTKDRNAHCLCAMHYGMLISGYNFFPDPGEGKRW